MTDPYARTEYSPMAPTDTGSKSVGDVLFGEVTLLRKKMDEVQKQFAAMATQIARLQTTITVVASIAGVAVTVLVAVFFYVRSDDTALLREARDSARDTARIVVDHEGRIDVLEANVRFGG